ncbi:hypothetical protein PRUPE_2G239800 [Prunus persica]|uniref:Poly(A) RNA polymerase mitochondrial-like central palm domain-containing protein n=1 Tax=Prunus persica TaxID=3760 RepID=A0A251QKS1_PRUPE|nr:protein HESO1 isoform X3 [Prunus persica]ONI24427.1 hypothetical protein PRUPE_2G239800 [Prunus persica]ONI24428.1 hypothetical protein PRUPE_2G239800 [Prunus persica]
MSAQSTLENTLKEILRVVKPLREDWTTRLQIIDELRGAVESVESLRGATVEPFGSFVSDLFTRWGDLDVSIEFSNGSFVSPYGKKQKQRLLGDVMRAMRQKGGWRRYQLIPNARVPILKVESNLQNVSCDISIDNLKCQMKSRLLFWISEIDTRFRDMVLLTCAPAIFPPLKDIYPGNLIDDLKGLRADTERRIEETCAANIRRFQSYNLRAENRSSLSELFISFLGKFSDISLKASELGICTYTGQWQAIKSNMRWLPQTYALFIEDPFEQPENSARAVSKRELTRISETFEMSHHMLISPNHSSLLATLVRPQMLSLMVRTPDWRRQPTHPQRFRAEGSHSPTPSNNNGPRQPTRPQVHRVVRSPSQVQPQYQTVKPKGPSEVQPQYQTVKPKGPSQVQPQFQTMNPKSHPNRATFKKPPLQTYEDQRQQIWRPRSDRPV